YGQGGHNSITSGDGDDIVDAGAGGFNTMTSGLGTDILLGRSPTDVINSSSSDYVYANSTELNPIPVYAPIPGPTAGGATLPAGADYFDRWAEFAGSATNSGVSNSPAQAIEPSIAAVGGSEFVTWADFRSGNYQIYVAEHTSAG